MMQTGTLGRNFRAILRAVGLGGIGLVLGLAPLTSATAATKKTAEVRKAAAPAAKAHGDKAKASAKVTAHSAKAAASVGKSAKPLKETKSTARGKAVQLAAQGNKASRVAARIGRSGKVMVVRGGKHDRVARGKGADRMVMARSTRASLRPVAHFVEPTPRLSFGQMAGLHHTADPLELKSSVALVVDQDTHEVLFSKNDHAVLPIASLTKLMTGVIVSDAGLPLDELLTITEDDVDYEKGSRSRLPVGTMLTRGELMHLALMSSENRAAHALGRTFPGGLSRFVGLMNAKAMMLGMKDTRYVEPTGLSSANRSSAADLATLVSAAYADPLLRQFSTSHGYEVAVGSRMVQYNNTNRLVLHPEWEIGLQKTGYISEAGQCLVMQARVAGRKLIMVFLDSAGKLSRLGDAERVRRWVEGQRPTQALAAAASAG